MLAVEAIKYYLYGILTPALKEYGVSDDFIKQIIDTVETQIYSCIRHWLDIPFRKALLLLGSEEGPFYEPAGKHDIKCFVVVTIRNSPFEAVQSKNYEQTGLSSALSDGQIKAITGRAITYFNQLNFEGFSKVVSEDSRTDLYGELAQRYPVAWTALQNVATAVGKKVEYTKMLIEKPFIMENLSPVSIENKGKFEAVLDGYSSCIDPQLSTALHNALTHNVPFTVDCFKMVTRNTEKLLRIMEFLLTHDRAFVTSNYYIENGYVERRISPVKAGHRPSDMIEHCSQTSDLGYRHAGVLKGVYSALKADDK